MINLPTGTKAVPQLNILQDCVYGVACPSFAGYKPKELLKKRPLRCVDFVRWHELSFVKIQKWKVYIENKILRYKFGILNIPTFIVIASSSAQI